jgi:dienelactone hydrolase
MIRKYKIIVCIVITFVSLIIYPLVLSAQDNESFEMTPISEEAFLTMTQFFQYDKHYPIDLRIVEKREMPDCVREKIIFTGSQGSRVPGYLATPKTGTPPYPCVLMLHGLDGVGKECWWDGDSIIDTPVRKAILTSGYAILALDAQYLGERKANNDFTSATEFVRNGWFNKFRDMVVQSTTDYRIAIDYLEIRPDIDSDRIGVFGYSMGGMMTFFLTGTESRIKVSVAAVAALMGSKSPTVAVPNAEYLFAALAPRNYAQAVNDRPFLMLMGKEDMYYTVDEAQQVFDLIDSQTKDLILYDSGHYLPIDYADDVVKWFNDHL